MTANSGPCPVCPACQSHDVVWLEAPSRETQVHYCRCAACAHVFSVTKDEHRLVRDITIRDCDDMS